jgi:hypothetical protein
LLRRVKSRNATAEAISRCDGSFYKDIPSNKELLLSHVERGPADPNPYTKGTPKVLPPILLRWPTMSEADAGGMAVEVEPSRQQVISFVAMRQIAAEGQSGKMALT